MILFGVFLLALFLGLLIAIVRDFDAQIKKAIEDALLEKGYLLLQVRKRKRKEMGPFAESWSSTGLFRLPRHRFRIVRYEAKQRQIHEAWVKIDVEGAWVKRLDWEPELV